MDEMRSELVELRQRARTGTGDVPFEPILEALEHPDELIRELAITVLYVVSQTEPARVRRVVPRLAAHLESDRSTVRTKTVLTLSNVAAEHPDAVRPYALDVVELLDDRSQTVVRGAVEALRRLATDDPSAAVDAVPTIASLLSAHIEDTRRDAAAILVLVSAEQPEAVTGCVEPLIELLEETVPTPSELRYDPNLTTDGTRASEQVRGHRTLVASDAGQKPNVRARESAAKVVAIISAAEPAEAVEILGPFLPQLFDQLEDRSPAIRASVAASLAYLAQEQPQAVTPAEERLIELLEEPIAISGSAVWALRYVQSERAVEALRAIVDRDAAPSPLRDTAKNALEQLEPEPTNSYGTDRAGL